MKRVRSIVAATASMALASTSAQAQTTPSPAPSATATTTTPTQPTYRVFPARSVQPYRGFDRIYITRSDSEYNG